MNLYLCWGFDVKIIVDANTLSAFSKNTDSLHNDFKPVLDCVRNGYAKLVYGGEKYLAELRKVGSALNLFSELNRSRKAIKLDDNEVDTSQKEIEGKITNPAFNDPHIIAIVIVGRCGLICSKDKSAHEFFKQKDLYPKRFRRPSIYSSLRNKNLLPRHS